MNAHRCSDIGYDIGVCSEGKNIPSKCFVGNNILTTLTTRAGVALRRLKACGLAVMTLAVLAPVCSANATTINAIFSGTLNGVDISGPNFGLSVGDKFQGSFGYDSVSGAVQSFSATVGGNNFVANNSHLEMQLFDGFETLFGIIGQLDNGLFMSVGLTNGTEVFASTPPQTLSSDDWFVTGFKISPTQFLPFETGVAELGTIRGGYTRPRTVDEFSLHTVPEPSVDLLFALALLAVPLIQELHRRQTSSRR